ncbi:MAG TPA: arylsulfotransferase family protein [Tepidisphaeraceae bacterium]|jgi:hypothetical protein
MKGFARVRLQLIVSMALMCFLAFVGGAYVAEFEYFPYPVFFKPAFAYLHAKQQRKVMEETAQAKAEQARPQGQVLVTATPAACEGYTFLTYDVNRPSTARLIDLQGNVVHEWHRSLREIWPNPPQRATPAPDTAIAWRYGQLLPNGDIIVTIKSYGDTPDGYGLAKLDKDSKVIWAVPANFHHHFSLAPDGRIFGITHEWRDTVKQPVKGAGFLPKQVLEDFLVELSPEGKELSRVSLLEAMASAGTRELLGSAVYGPRSLPSAAAFRAYKVNDWDPLHPNDVEFISAEFASHHPLMKEGMLLISLRDLDALILLDPAKRSVTWAMRGPWVRQHDPDLLPDGHLLLFDNLGNNVAGGPTRILEIEPQSGKVAWSFSGKSRRLRSERSGGVQRLPNGNTLISEDDRGKLLEVTSSGDTAWEYGDSRVHHATRVSKEWIKFAPAGHGMAGNTAATTTAGGAGGAGGAGAPRATQQPGSDDGSSDE